MLYRKLPVIIKAFRLGYEATPEWFINHKSLLEFCSEEKNFREIRVKIETLEGCIFANKGDYIILGIAEEIYPCKADIFEKSYEVMGYDNI